MSNFLIGSLIGYAAVVLAAYRLRGRAFVAFFAIIVGIFTVVSVEMRPLLSAFGVVPDVLQACVYVHFLGYMRPRLRSWPFKLLVQLPAAFFSSGTLLAFPSAILAAFGVQSPWLLLPYAFGLLGLFESLYTRESVHTLVLDAVDAGALRRYPRGDAKNGPELTFIQITDPHLGPFMSIARFTRICERAVARNPDLIFLTGDFLTIESNRAPDALKQALAPLAAARGKVFACLGNHDHEAPDVVRDALAMHGVQLLVDDAVEIETKLGRVQILGFDFKWRERKAHMDAVCAQHPKPADALRIVLLHDPGAFRHMPEAEGDLVLSGHTHGGQVGLVTFGLPWTFLSAFSKIPDHGFWASGKNRLYVHRGTGHYGFPLRVGVPAEQSLLRIQRG